MDVVLDYQLRLYRPTQSTVPGSVTSQALDLEVDEFFSYAPPPNDLGCVGVAAEAFLSRHKDRSIALVTVRVFIHPL